MDAEPVEKFAQVLPTSCMSVFINPCAPLADAPLVAEVGSCSGCGGFLEMFSRRDLAPLLQRDSRPLGPQRWRESLTAAPGGCGPRARGEVAGPRGTAGAFCSAPADKLCGRCGSFLSGSAPSRRWLSHRAASWLGVRELPALPRPGRPASPPPPPAATPASAELREGPSRRRGENKKLGAAGERLPGFLRRRLLG